jgi:uncharacterized protein YndB with AHSA1/START domain
MEKASPGQVYESVAIREGLASWWTEKVTGESEVGKVLQFRFAPGGSDFEVLELTRPKRVRWKCVAGPEQWIDTRVYFDIMQEEGETILLFKHCGWREETEYMHHRSTSWASFLIGLKELLDGGQGKPFGPRYRRISRWSK